MKRYTYSIEPFIGFDNHVWYRLKIYDNKKWFNKVIEETSFNSEKFAIKIANNFIDAKEYYC
ncbi:MAG: hypothetical protein OXF77_00925 [Thaumarchaeota archaeon]|nr:hypothetical protein [Nitrososphaerota archaeon]